MSDLLMDGVKGKKIIRVGLNEQKNLQKSLHSNLKLMRIQKKFERINMEIRQKLKKGSLMRLCIGKIRRNWKRKSKIKDKKINHKIKLRVIMIQSNILRNYFKINDIMKKNVL